MCVCACVRSAAELCPTLCDPMDCSPPGSFIVEIFQARILVGGYQFLLQGNLPDSRIEPKSPASTALAEGFFTTVPPGKPVLCSAGHYFNVMEYWLGLSHEAAATAKSLQSCPTLCNPIDNSPTRLLSLEFSRQEHWSGLPFPSPVHESEK